MAVYVFIRRLLRSPARGLQHCMAHTVYPYVSLADLPRSVTSLGSPARALVTRAQTVGYVMGSLLVNRLLTDKIVVCGYCASSPPTCVTMPGVGMFTTAQSS